METNCLKIWDKPRQSLPVTPLEPIKKLRFPPTTPGPATLMPERAYEKK